VSYPFFTNHSFLKTYYFALSVLYARISKIMQCPYGIMQYSRKFAV